MNLSREEVLEVLAEPEIDRPTKDRRISSRGQLSVCYNPDSLAIVTILWRYADVTYVRPKPRLRWKDDPATIIGTLLAFWRNDLDATTSTAAGIQILSHFGLVCSPLPVHAVAAEVSNDRFVVLVDDFLVDLTIPTFAILPDRFWLGEMVEAGSLAYQHADLLWAPDWRTIPPGLVEKMTEQMHDHMKEQ